MVQPLRPAPPRAHPADLSALRAALRPLHRAGRRAGLLARFAAILPALGLALLLLALALRARPAGAAEPGGVLLRGAVDVQGIMLSEGDDGRRGADPGTLFAAFGAPLGAQLFVGAPVAVQDGEPLFLGATLGARRGKAFGRADSLAAGPFTYGHDRLGADLTVLRRRPSGELGAGIGAGWHRVQTRGESGRSVGESDGWGVGFTIEGARTLVGGGGRRLSAGLFFAGEIIQLDAGSGALPYSADGGAVSAVLGLRVSGATLLR
jgi:hypothetical protein